MSGIAGMHDVKLLRDFGQPYLNLTVDRRQAARFGINVTDIQDAIQTAVGGNAVSQVLIGEQRYDVVARYQAPYRNTQQAIEKVRLLSPSGERVSLAELRKAKVKDGAYDIYTMFRSFKWSLLVLANVAMARIGGLLALLVTGTNFSVSSGVGFLALFGVSVQTGVIMLEYINQLRARGQSIQRHFGRFKGSSAANWNESFGAQLPWLDLVHVAPHPVLPRLDGAHERMLTFVKMFGCMLVLG